MPVKVSTLREELPTKEQTHRVVKLLMGNPGMAYTGDELRLFLELEQFSEILGKIMAELTTKKNSRFKVMSRTESNYYWYE